MPLNNPYDLMYTLYPLNAGKHASNPHLCTDEPFSKSKYT